jgi:branched-chain amino acid transport system permease protein
MWFKRVNKRNLISTLVGIVVMAVVSMLSTSSYTLPGILNLIFIYSIAALALNIVCGCLGEFVLGHAGFLLIGYTVSVLLTKDISQFFTMQLDEVYLGNMLLYISTGAQLYPMGYVVIILVVIVAAIFTAVIGFLVGLIALGRLKGDYLAIVTLGISLIFVNLCKYDGYPNDLSLGFGLGIRISNLSATPILVFIFLVLCLTLIVMFMSSRFGRNILACRDDNIAAEACGVPVNKTKVMAFTFSSLIAGIAGALLAFVQSQSPNDLGQDMSIKFLIIIVLGGLGSLTGSIIAAILIVLYEQWFCLQPWVPDFIASNPKIVYGIILVVIMLFRSSGLLGKSEFTWNWFYTNIKKLWNKFSKKKQIKEGDE